VNVGTIRVKEVTPLLTKYDTIQYNAQPVYLPYVGLSLWRVVWVGSIIVMFPDNCALLV